MAAYKTNSSSKSRSKFIPVANSILSVTGKGVESTFKYLATDHSGSDIRSCMMGTQQSFNYSKAKISLLLRESERGLARSSRFTTLVSLKGR